MSDDSMLATSEVHELTGWCCVLGNTTQQATLNVLVQWEVGSACIAAHGAVF